MRAAHSTNSRSGKAAPKLAAARAAMLDCPAMPLDLEFAARPDPLVGLTLDRYRVLEKIGEGGMGAVYAVEHVLLQKRMAMKLLRADLSRKQDLVARFQNEAIAASRIGQENIVAVTDFGRTPDGLVYFVMEELHGESLGRVIHGEGRIPVPRTVDIAAQLCRALQAAHAAGIIHRDLKPDNVILVEKDGRPDFVKVLDFGISKVGGAAGGERITQVGTIVGTPEYMAPEQAAGKPVDPRSDVYSLGVLLFEMLTGRLPFEGDTAVAILLKHQTQPPPRLSDVIPDGAFPAALEAAVARALAKRPADRQQSMSELLADLQGSAAQGRFTQPELRLPPGRDEPSSVWITPSLVSPPPKRPSPAAVLPVAPKPAVQPPAAEATQTEVTVPRRFASADAEVTVPAAIGLSEFDATMPGGPVPRRGRGIWLAVGAVVLVGAVAGYLSIRRTPPPPAPEAATVAAPELPPPPSAPVPSPVPRPEVAPPPVVPLAPNPMRAFSRPLLRATAPAPAAIPHRAAPPQAEAPAADPYQKVDDLKTAY